MVYAFERKFDTLVEISKKFISKEINNWIENDMDVKQVIVLNDKTNNSLLEIIFNKYRLNMNMFNSICSHRLPFIIVEGHNYNWSNYTSLNRVIKFK